MISKKKRLRETLSQLLKAKKALGTEGSSDHFLDSLKFHQTELSEHIESLLRSYDLETRRLAKEIAASEEVSQEALEGIHARQKALLRIVRRLQAAEHSDSALIHAYKDWVRRESFSEESSSVDHPRIRKEIIASELRLRGIHPESLISAQKTSSYEGSAIDADPFAAVEEMALKEMVSVPAEEACFSEEVVEDEYQENAPVWNRSEETQVLGALDDLSCELRKIISRPKTYEFQKEIVLFLRDLRSHHAVLRLHDRQKGIRRYRVLLGHPLYR